METDPVETLINRYQTERQEVLSEYHAKQILMRWGLPVPRCVLAETASDAIDQAEVMGYPVVLKVHSAKITHKSDLGGVKLNLMNAAAVAQAYAEISASCSPVDPAFKVLVQPMLPPGIEVILGMSQDAQFGPVIMFGLGGLYTELFQDVAFRLLPVNQKQALDMLISVKASKLFQGYRGKPGGDMNCVAQMVVRLSDLIARHPAIVELDLNPVLVYPDCARVADARIVLQSSRIF